MRTCESGYICYHKYDKTVNAEICKDNPHSGHNGQSGTQINDLTNYLSSSMQCYLNGVQIDYVPKFLANGPSETTNAIQITVPDAAYLLLILLQLQGVTSYFDLHSSSISEYESEEIPKIHLTAEEPPWDPSRAKYSKERLE